MYSTNDCAANSFFVHLSVRHLSDEYIFLITLYLFFYNSHFWEKAFLSFLSAYSPVLIFLVSLRIRLFGGSLSSLQLNRLLQRSLLSAAACRYCLLQLSLLSAAAIATVCCSYRYCLRQLSLLSAAAIATVCCNYRYCLLQLSLCLLHLSLLSAAAAATVCLLLLFAAAIATVCCSCRYCLLHLSLLSAHLPLRSAAAAKLAAVAATYRWLLELHYGLELLLSQSP